MKHWSKIPCKLQERKPSLMGQKSRVGISVHTHECREKHFQQSAGDRLNPIIVVWILKGRKFLLFLCLGEGENRSLSYHQLLWVDSLKYAEFSDPHAMGKEVRVHDPELLIHTREKVYKVGIVMRNEAVFCRESKYWTSTWLNTSRMLVQGTGILAAVSGVYIPAVYRGFIVLIEGIVQLQGF